MNDPQDDPQILLDQFNAATGDDKEKLRPKLIEAADAIDRKNLGNQVEKDYSDFDTFGGTWTNDGAQWDDDSKARVANIRFIALATGKSIDDTQPTYDGQRAKFSRDYYGDENLTEKGFYDQTQKRFQNQKKQDAAYGELNGLAIQDAFDAKPGESAPSVANFQKWKEKYGDVFQGPSLQDFEPGADSQDPSHPSDAAAEAYFSGLSHLRMQLADSLPKAKEVLSLLQSNLKSPDGDESDTISDQNLVTPEQVDSATNALIDSSPEERKTILGLVSAYAQAKGKDPKSFGNQLIESIGRTGVDIRSGLESQDAESSIKAVKGVLTGEDRKGFPGLQDKATVGIFDPNDLAGSLSTVSVEGSVKNVFHEDAKPLTEDQKSALLKEADRQESAIKLTAQLRQMVKGQIDPVKVNHTGIVGLAEGSAYAAGSFAPYLGLQAVPYVGQALSVGALSASEYERLSAEHPDLSPDQKTDLALGSGIAQGVLMHFNLKALEGLPLTSEFLGGLTDISKSGVARNIAAKASLSAVELGAQSEGFAATPAIVDGIASNLEKDKPGINARVALSELRDAQPGTLSLALPFWLVGLGAIGVRGVKGGVELFNHSSAMQDIGLPKDLSNRIALTPEDKKDSVVQDAFTSLSTYQKQSIVDRLDAHVVANKFHMDTPSAPTLERGTTESGDPSWILRNAKGDEIFNSTSLRSAGMAFQHEAAEQSRAEYESATEGLDTSENNGMDSEAHRAATQELVQHFIRTQGDTEFNFSGLSKSARDLVEKDPDSAQNVFESVKAAGGDLSDGLEGMHVLGEAGLKDVGDQYPKAVVTLHEGHGADTVIEEANHAFVLSALTRGEVDIPTLQGWLKDTESATGTRLPSRTQGEVIESMGVLGKMYAAGKIATGELPPNLLRYMRQLAEFLNQSMVGALRLRNAINEGRVGGDIVKFLDKSTGIHHEKAESQKESDEMGPGAANAREMQNRRTVYGADVILQMEAEGMDVPDRAKWEEAIRKNYEGISDSEVDSLWKDSQEAALQHQIYAGTKPMPQIVRQKALPIATTESPTSVKNSVIDKERRARGLPAVEPVARQEFGEAWDSASRKIDEDPRIGYALVYDLLKKPRAIGAEESAILLHQQIEIQNAYEKAVEKVNSSFDNGDASAISEARVNAARLSDELLDIYNAGKAAGTETGRGLNARKMLAKEDYSLARTVARVRAAHGGESLTDSEHSQIKEEVLDVAKTAEAFDKHISESVERSRQSYIDSAIRRAQERVAKKARIAPGVISVAAKGAREVAVKIGQRALSSLEKRAELARASIRERATRFSAGVDPTALTDAATIGAYHLAKVGVEFAKWADAVVKDIGEWVKPHLKEVFEKSKKLLSEHAATEKMIDGLAARIAAGDTDFDLSRYANSLVRSAIESGITDRDAVVNAVHSQLSEAIPKLSLRETQDAISGYGKYKELAKDTISKKAREIKGELQQLSKLEDMQRGQAPKKTGVERREVSDAERRLQAKVNEAKKKGGYEISSPSKSLRSALDSIKARLRNQIKDYAHRIDTGEKPPDKTQVEYDAEAKSLVEERNKLRDTVKALEGTRETTDEQRLKIAQKSVERSISELERRIKENDLAPKVKKSLTSPEIEALKSRRDAFREEFRHLQELKNEAEGKGKRTPEQIALQSYKTRQTNRLAELNEQLARDQFDKPVRNPIKLDDEALRLKAANEDAKSKIEKRVEEKRLAARGKGEKFMDTVVKWRRGFLLSSPITLAKLTAAAFERMVITPIEEISGAAISKVLPEISLRAPREGGGFNVRAESLAITRGFMEGLKDAKNILFTGKGRLDDAFGKKHFEPRSIIDFFGSMHGALKAVAKRSEFERSFQKRVAHAMTQGIDVSDPMVQTRLSVEAYQDANRAIFMQNNAAVQLYNRALSVTDKKDKNTGKVPLDRKIAGTAVRIILPIVKVPTNVVAETIQYALGIPLGSHKVARALSKGVENLHPEEADLIMRQLKKGSLGGALLLLGFFNPVNVGGYYQEGEKRRDDDAQAGGLKMFGYNIPRYLVHNPLLETLQIGATVRRVAESKLHKKDRDTQGIGAGLIAGALGLAEEVPFVEQMLQLSKIADKNESGYYWGELAKSLIVPAAINWAATFSDTDYQGNSIKRKASTVWEHVESGIPGLRQNLPRKK